MILCVLLMLLPTLSSCCSPTVCVLILTLMTQAWGQGWQWVGRVMFFFFFYLFDFVFLSPFQPVPFPPPKKKRKRQTQIKYLSGTVPLAQAASVCFVLPPSLPGMPPVWTLGPQFHDLFTPSTLSQPLSLLSLIFSTFIASLHHGHYQLGRAGPLLSCSAPRFPCMWIPPRECSGPGSFGPHSLPFLPTHSLCGSRLSGS